MEKKNSIKSHLIDSSLRFEVLTTYYSNGESLSFTSKQCGVSRTSVYRWKTLFENDVESLSLPEELLTRLIDMRKKQKMEALHSCESAESLKQENDRLRKALAYSELRNEALNELLKIGREEYGVDLLKKAGAKR